MGHDAYRQRHQVVGSHLKETRSTIGHAEPQCGPKVLGGKVGTGANLGWLDLAQALDRIGKHLCLHPTQQCRLCVGVIATAAPVCHVGTVRHLDPLGVRLQHLNDLTKRGPLVFDEVHPNQFTGQGAVHQYHPTVITSGQTQPTGNRTFYPQLDLFHPQFVP